jgi:saccharopine dehydrogenase (NAD+, L-lysine-forming)
MRVLLVGSGAQGSVMARHLGHSEAIDEVVCADVSPARAQAARRFADSRRVRDLRLDATHAKALARALSQVDMVVNASLPRFNLPLTEAALAAGVHYQDLAGDYPKIAAQLRLSRRFARKGRLGLLQCGASPGVTNVLAREAVDALETVDAVHLRLVSRIDASRPVSLWSAETALEDMEEPPAVFRDGSVVRVRPFSDEETFDFPPPFGSQRVVQHMHEEPLTFGRFLGKGLRYVDLKMGGAHIDQMRVAASLGLFSRTPVSVDKHPVVPRSLLVSLLPPALTPSDVVRLLKRGVLHDATGCHVVHVEGTRNGHPVTLRYTCLGPSLRQVQAWMPGATNMSYRVGVAAALFVEMVARGEADVPGVYPPECLTPEARAIYVQRLRENHLDFDLAET